MTPDNQYQIFECVHCAVYNNTHDYHYRLHLAAVMLNIYIYKWGIQSPNTSTFKIQINKFFCSGQFSN